MVKLRYIRKGKCKRCGTCCLDENCEYFELNKKTGIATCKIFNSSERPLRCKWFPQAPPILIEKCGYYFIDTWENNRVVKAKEV
jgi:hypothetical protein